MRLVTAGIADQLHNLLAAAGISGSIVLMGHSIAGLHMRAYLSRYPQDIAGVVFVDAATPAGILRMHEDYERFTHQLVWLKPLMALGVGRLAGQCGSTPPSGMEAYTAWYQADNYCNPSYPTTYGRELEGFEPSVRQVAHTGPFGDLPILIFSRDPDIISSPSSGLQTPSVRGLGLASRMVSRASRRDRAESSLDGVRTTSRSIVPIC